MCGQDRKQPRSMVWARRDRVYLTRRTRAKEEIFASDPKALGCKVGTILFTDWAGHPGSPERWVDFKGDLSVPILQAHLIERDLPIKLVLSSLWAKGRSAENRRSAR